MKDRVSKIMEQSILANLAPNLRRIIKRVKKERLNGLVEIRLRANQPLILETIDKELFIDQKGIEQQDFREAYYITKDDIRDTLNLMANNSLYALETELKSGYLTLDGGHRVGLVGEVIREGKTIKRIKNISGLNIRICQEIIGAADGVFKEIIKGRNDIYNTLIISPPRCGKTTLIRDLSRQISNGNLKLNFAGLKVGVVDERSEIGGAYQGVAQNRLGIRTDLLDRAPKSEGMMLLIRSMSPDVIITDELGSKEDAHALQEVLNAGVRVVTTIHGHNLKEVEARPSLKGVINSDIFKRIIVLSSRKGAGTIKNIIKN